VLGVAVASVPSLLAVIGPLLEGSRPRPYLVAAALVVTGGAALVQGVGRTDGLGIVWAVVVFGCEAGFTLLAIPVLTRHGPWGVSVHATWIAAVIFAVLGLTREGPAAAAQLTRADWLAVGYLCLAVTAAAFVLWYSSVRRLGASKAGLLTGVAPVAAALTGLLLGGPAPSPLVWAGIAVVAVGLALGLRGAAVRGDLCSFSIPVTSGATFPRWFPGSCMPKGSPATSRRFLLPTGSPRSPRPGWRPDQRANCRRYRPGGARSRGWG
jgi:drug/metabolite transporter (DMT)-like permease